MQITKRWIQISYLFLAALTWWFFFHFMDTVWDIANIPVPADWFLMPAQIVAFIAAIIVFIVLQRNEKINQFSNEVATELSKVTWPERKETLLSAGVISIMIAICALILFAFDSIWGTVVKLVY